MGTELEPAGKEGEDFIVVNKHGKDIVVPIRKPDPETGEMPGYDSNPQIRAFQMVHEGRLGGAGRGQGRKRKPRAAEMVAEHVRKEAGKIIKAIDAGLDDDNVKIKLSAAEMALKVERDEAALQLKEDSADVDGMDKNELLETIFALANDPSIEAAIGTFDLPESAIREVTSGNSNEAAWQGEEVSEAEVVSAAAAATEGKRSQVARASARAPKARTHARKPRTAGRGAAASDGPKPLKPFKARAKRRAAD